jgi:hypothetical protein
MDLANGHNSVFKFLDLLRTKGFWISKFFLGFKDLAI